MEEYSINKERYDRINERLTQDESTMTEHRKDIDMLKNQQARTDENLKGVIKELSELNITMRWFVGAMIGSLAGFFFYAVQRVVF